MGVIGNKGEKPKGVVCTDVNPTSEKCGDEQPENTVCLQWSDRDNNICMGKSKFSIRTSSALYNFLQVIMEVQFGLIKKMPREKSRAKKFSVSLLDRPMLDRAHHA